MWFSRLNILFFIFLDDLLFAIVAAVPIYIEYIKNHPEALKVRTRPKKSPIIRPNEVYFKMDFLITDRPNSMKIFYHSNNCNCEEDI